MIIKTEFIPYLLNCFGLYLKKMEIDPLVSHLVDKLKLLLGSGKQICHCDIELRAALFD